MKAKNIAILILIVWISFVVFGITLIVTDNSTIKSNCPMGSDLIDDDVCVDSNGNYFNAEKEIDHTYKMPAIALFLFVGVGIGSVIFVEGVYYD